MKFLGFRLLACWLGLALLATLEMACASAIAELASGKTVKEALALDRASLIASVGGLPEASSHAAQLAMDGLFSVLKQIKSR